MKIKQVILFFLFLLLIYSCAKKKYPESVVENDVVYYARMDLEGKSIDMQAGEDNYYMYSDFEQDSNQVYNFNSRIASSTCTNCQGSLEFKLYDSQSSPISASVDIDSSLRIGKRVYQNISQGPFYVVEFQSTFNKSSMADDFVWDFGTGVNASGFLVAHTFTNAGPYTVCLRAKSNANCYSSACNDLSFNPRDLRVSVSGAAIAGDSVEFTANVSGGRKPFTYLWNFGDGTTGNGISNLHLYSFPGSYAVELMVTDSLGNTTSTRYNAVTKSDNSSCAVNYSISNIATSANGAHNWAKASIIYTAVDGTVYKSNLADQSANSSFEIISVESAGLNEKGQTIKKVKLRFGATLANGNKLIRIENGEAVIAVAYQ